MAVFAAYVLAGWKRRSEAQQTSLCAASVERGDDGKGAIGSLHLTQEVQLLLSFCWLQTRCLGSRPGHICDVHTQELSKQRQYSDDSRFVHMMAQIIDTFPFYLYCLLPNHS